MSKHINPHQARRNFLKMSAAITAMVMTGGAASWLRAAELPHVTDSDATAKMLGYVEDATTTKDARYKTGSQCANCQLYAGNSTGYGPCQLFPGKSVSANGWCSAYMPKK